MNGSRKCATVLFVFVTTLAPTWSLAAPAVAGQMLPPVIAEGFDAYKKEGSQAAVSAWLKGSALEGDKNAMAQMAGIAQVETFFGKFVKAYLLAGYDLSPTCQMIYVALDYERGPAFMKFLLFRVGEKSVVANLKFHTEPEQILPGQLMSITK